MADFDFLKNSRFNKQELADALNILTDNTNSRAKVLYLSSTTIGNTASASVFTLGHEGIIPANWFGVNGDTCEVLFRGHFNANTGSSRAMIFRVAPAVDSLSDFLATGNVTNANHSVEVKVVLNRISNTELRVYFIAIFGDGTTQVVNRTGIGVTTWNQVFNLRHFVRGSVAGELTSDFLSIVGMKKV